LKVAFATGFGLIMLLRLSDTLRQEVSMAMICVLATCEFYMQDNLSIGSRYLLWVGLLFHVPDQALMHESLNNRQCGRSYLFPFIKLTNISERHTACKDESTHYYHNRVDQRTPFYREPGPSLQSEYRCLSSLLSRYGKRRTN
jgi:hypothetical protein